MVVASSHPAAAYRCNRAHTCGREVHSLKILGVGLSRRNGDEVATCEEFCRSTPFALAFSATIGTHLSDVCSGSGKTFNSEWIAVGFNEVLFIIVETNLPSGGRAVFFPAECGGMVSSADHFQ